MDHEHMRFCWLSPAVSTVGRSVALCQILSFLHLRPLLTQEILSFISAWKVDVWAKHLQTINPKEIYFENNSLMHKPLIKDKGKFDH